MSVLEAGDLVKTHPGEPPVRVLEGVSLEVAAGELVGIRGVSGAGKSTLLHLLGGLERPDAGHVHVAGQDPWRLSRSGRARLRLDGVGFLFQDPRLVPELTVAGNVALPARAHGADKVEARERVHRLLSELDLEDVSGRRPKALSGGELQRAGLARAVVNAPEVLLLDEATAHLDEAAATRVLGHVREQIDGGTGGVVTSHDEATLAACDRVLVLEDGVLQDATT